MALSEVRKIIHTLIDKTDNMNMFNIIINILNMGREEKIKFSGREEELIEKDCRESEANENLRNHKTVINELYKSIF
jgi:hypothetical protein